MRGNTSMDFRSQGSHGSYPQPKPRRFSWTVVDTPEGWRFKHPKAPGQLHTLKAVLGRSKRQAEEPKEEQQEAAE